VFGKDFNLEKETRKLVRDISDGTINPDLVMHGLSAQGFGIPHVLNAVGAQLGIKPFAPTFDVSKNVGMGDPLGFDPLKVTGLYPVSEGQKRDMQWRESMRAGGALTGTLGSYFDAMASVGDPVAMKKWEAAMPKFLGNISRAFRYAYGGRETNAAGNTVIRFDVNDTEQLGEILLRAAGFQPRRLTEEYERIGARKDSSDYFDMRRAILLRQFGDAVKNQSDEEKASVVEAVKEYNQKLPEEAKAKSITGAQLHASVINRLRNAAKQEEGIPLKKSDVMISRDIEKYYPKGWPRGQVGATGVK
jgi:hypothetical protein